MMIRMTRTEKHWRVTRSHLRNGVRRSCPPCNVGQVVTEISANHHGRDHTEDEVGHLTTKEQNRKAFFSPGDISLRTGPDFPFSSVTKTSTIWSTSKRDPRETLKDEPKDEANRALSCKLDGEALQWSAPLTVITLTRHETESLCDDEATTLVN